MTQRTRGLWESLRLAWLLQRQGLRELAASPEVLSGVGRLERFRKLLRAVADDEAPNRLFDSGYYLKTNPDVEATGIPPFTHFVLYGAPEGRDPHPLFDSSFYRQSYPDAAGHPGGPLGHFLQVGAHRHHKPHALFDTGFYARTNPDAAASGMNPLIHFLYRGDGEGRKPHPLFDPTYYRETNDTVASAGMNTLEHFVLYGGTEGRNPHPLFDCAYYLATTQKQTSAAGGPPVDGNPLVDFMRSGADQGRNPHALFDCSYYVESNEGVDFEGVNPLVHFVLEGAGEARNPHPDFDLRRYVERNPEIAGSTVNPLVHFLARGDPENAFARAAELRDLALHRRYDLEATEIAVHPDILIAVNELGAFISGWASSDTRRLTSLHLQAASGHRTTDFLASAARPPRADASTGSERDPEPISGFDAFVRDPALIDGYRYLSLVSHWSGEASSSHWINYHRGTVDAQIKGLLAVLQDRLPYYAGSRRLRRVLDEHFGPSIEALAGRRGPRGSARELVYGTPVVDPAASIIIPLFGRLDLVEHQLALFANDPTLSRAEILYVLDDPRLEPIAPVRCGEWHRLYRVPFTLLCLEKNSGFSAACNVGAQNAHSDVLFFLNSDVMPKEKGWLPGLLDVLASSSDASILGARLLWEDGSIQHNGLGFVKEADQDVWVNVHPLKGLGGLGNDPREPFEVPAVTGAALMIERPLFERLDGFDEGYVIGGYEDSDLCLRALASGRGVWMAPSVELYHLEGKSQALHGETSRTSARMWYNAWRQDRRHGAFLSSLAESGRFRTRALSWVRAHGWGEASGSRPERVRSTMS